MAEKELDKAQKTNDRFLTKAVSLKAKLAEVEAKETDIENAPSEKWLKLKEEAEKAAQEAAEAKTAFEAAKKALDTARREADKAEKSYSKAIEKALKDADKAKKAAEKDAVEARKMLDKEIEKAKTLEQLQEEQRKEEEEQAKKAGPQLTKEQVNRLSGPKIALSQPVDKDIALKNKIGLQGDYIQFIDINEARKLIPDLDIAELGQQFLPIEILPNGTANVVSEDNMRFSTIKGSNSTEYSISENNDGTRGLDQSIVTFAIPGTNNYISVGFNEQHTSDPYYEVKFQTIDRDSNRMGGEELLQSLIGTIEDPDQHNERRNNTEGQLKYTKELVTEEQAEKYAKSEGIYLEDSRNPDLKTAREELERLAVGGKSVNDIVQESENDQLQLGHPDSKRHY